MGTVFKPFLGNNDPYLLEDLRFPLISTIKKDGVRGIARTGELFTRSHMSQKLPLIKNKQIQQLAEPVKQLTKQISNISFDFEIYVHGLPLNEIIMFTNTEDIKSREHYNKIKNKVRELKFPLNYYLSLPKNIEFYLFDSVVEGWETIKYTDRIQRAIELTRDIPNVTFVNPVPIFNLYSLETEYQRSLNEGFEGLVLRNIDSPYKYGRSTFKEHYFLKMKPIEEYEAIIIEINEKMFNYGESTESFAGYSIKQKLQENREESGIAATATVMWEGKQFKISLNGTENERVQIWENRDSYIGKTLIFKGMPYGMKDVPRFPRLVKILT